MKRRCERYGCDRPYDARGLCVLHYAREHYLNQRIPVRPPWSTVFAGEVDEVVVQRLMAGDRTVEFTAFERREAVRRLDAARVPRAQIARRIGVHGRQVYRDLDWLASRSAGPSLTVVAS